MSFKTKSLCVCVSGLVNTLAGFPESSIELRAVRLAEGMQNRLGNTEKKKKPGL